MVTGSRFLDPDGEGYRSSATRRMGIRIFSSVVSLITGQRVTDPTSGFRMTNRRGIELFARDYPHDYPEVEAILLMHAHRLRSCEIPVQMRPRMTGESAISSTQSVYYMVKVLLAVFVGLFRRKPTIEPKKPRDAGRGAVAVTKITLLHALVDRRHVRAAAARVRAGAPQAPVRALRDPVAARGRHAVRAGRLEGAAHLALARRRHLLPAVRSVRGRDRADRDDPAELLARRLAPVRPEQDPGPASQPAAAPPRRDETTTGADAGRSASRRTGGTMSSRSRPNRARRSPPKSSPAAAERLVPVSDAVAVVVVTHQSADHLADLLQALMPQLRERGRAGDRRQRLHRRHAAACALAAASA